MSESRVGVIVTAAAAVAVAAAAAWAASSLGDARDDAARAAVDTAACRQLADQITSGRRAPAATGGADVGHRLEAGDDARRSSPTRWCGSPRNRRTRGGDRLKSACGA